MKTLWTMLTLLAAGSLAGCGFLATQPAPDPDPGQQARLVTLALPDSVMAQLAEAFRVGQVSPAYERCFKDSTTGDGRSFTALFDPADRQTLASAGDVSGQHLLNGGWHKDQERSAFTSVMNTFIGVKPDSARGVFTKIRELDGNSAEPIWEISYDVKASVGSSGFASGTAIVTFVRDENLQYRVLTWEDRRDPNRPPNSSYGALRFRNRN